MQFCLHSKLYTKRVSPKGEANMVNDFIAQLFEFVVIGLIYVAPSSLPIGLMNFGAWYFGT